MAAKKNGKKPKKQASTKSTRTAATRAPKSKSAAPRRASTRVAPKALTVSEKQRLLKPLTNYAELVARLAAAWAEHGRVIRVPGLTAARLASLLRRAERASSRENELRARLERRLQPLADARLRAEHEAWKAALDVHAMVKSATRVDASLASAFAFFADALQRRRAGADEIAEPVEPSPTV